MEQPQLFPVSLNLQGKTCLVVGGGAVAEKRVRSLLSCGAVVRLVSPDVTPWLAEAAEVGTLVWKHEPFRPEHTDGAMVVCVATSERETNAEIYRLAKQRHCLVNVADDPPHCDFYMPAVVRRGHLTVAVSTEGQAPAFAAWLCRLFDRILDRRLDRVVAGYARIRPLMKQRYPEMRPRVQAWERRIEDDAPQVFHQSVTE
jgi:siroheme synthase-like protein